jgi:hypothetical protein
MWSSSSRPGAGRPKRIVVCGTSRSTTSTPPSPSRGAAVGGGQVGEDLIDQRGRARFVDRADDRDRQGGAGEEPLRQCGQVCANDRSQTVRRAAGRQPIGMAGKDAPAPGAAGDGARLVGLVADLGQQLLAHPRRRRFVETRRVDGEAGELAGAVEMAGKRLHPPAEEVALGMEGKLDRLLVERFVERLIVEIGGALVEQAGKQSRRAGLAGRVLGGAAAKGEFERHQRHGVIFHQPEAHAARTDEVARIDGARGERIGDGLVHQRFLGRSGLTPAAALGRRRQAAVGCSSGGCRYPVTARRRSSHLLAAATMSSARTASMRCGHCCTSSIVSPVASDAPYHRASANWLSWA